MTDSDIAVDQDLDAQVEGGASDEEEAQEKLKAAVTVEAEDIGTLRKKITVTIAEDYIQGRRQEQFAELKKDANVPGFRPGRAPLSLIEKRFGRDVGDQLSAPVVGGAYMAALEKIELKDKTIGDPRIWVKVPEVCDGDPGQKKSAVADKLVSIDEAMDYLELPKDEAMTFACEVELRPEFELPSLTGIKLEQQPLDIGDEMVQQEIDRVRATRGQYVPVTKGKIEEDDLLVVNYKCTSEDRSIGQEDNFTLAARDQRVEGINFEGLGEKLIGKKSDATISAEATIPDDFDDADLRGKSAKLEITILDMKRLELPELDAAFFESLGVADEDELRKIFSEQLELQRKQLGQNELRAGVRKHLLAEIKLDIPEGLSQRQTDRAVAKRLMELYRMGIPQQEIDKRIDELKATAATEAIEDLKLFFIMEKVSEELDVDVSEEELNSAIASIAARRGRRFDRVRDELSQAGGLESLYVQLRDEKIMDKLIEDGEITEVTKKSPKTKSASKKKTPKKKKKAADD